MADFLNTPKYSSQQSRRIKTKYSDIDYKEKSNGIIINNSKSIGNLESIYSNWQNPNAPSGLDLMQGLIDATTRDKIPLAFFSSADIATKVQRLKGIMLDARIRTIVDRFALDAIIYDDNGMFCNPISISHKLLNRHHAFRDLETATAHANKIEAEYIEAFHRIYSAFGFDDGHSAYKLFKRFLVEGMLAFEIIYKDDRKTIHAFKEISCANLIPRAEEVPGGGVRIVYDQYTLTNQGRSKERERTLTDDEIVFLSYSDMEGTNHVSYIERFLRDINIVRNLEQALIIWFIMNSSPHLDVSVLVGKTDYHKAIKDVNRVLSHLQEDIEFDDASGEFYNSVGRKLLGTKTFGIPMMDNGTPTIKIDPRKFEGVDLQNNPVIQHFWTNIKMSSQQPMSYFDYTKDGGQWNMGPDSLPDSQIKWMTFVKGMLNLFSNLLTKPIYIQMCKCNRMLADDDKVRNAIGVKFNLNNHFEKRVMAEQTTFLAKAVAELSKIPANSAGDIPSLFWIEKFALINPEDEIRIKEIKAMHTGAKKGEDAKKVADSEMEGSPSGGGGGGGFDSGGGAQAQGGQAQPTAQGQAEGGGEDTADENVEVGGGAE